MVNITDIAAMTEHRSLAQCSVHLPLEPANKRHSEKMSLELLQTQEINLRDFEEDSRLANIENEDPHESEELELKQFERLENLLRCVNW